MPETLIDSDLLKRLEQLALASRRFSAGRMKGERRSRRRGEGMDFADHRNYTPGDDLRALDWKIYGRLERLFIKRFLEEEDLKVHILIDASQSMSFGEPSKLLYAKRIAAALGHICLARMESLSACAFGDGLLARFGPRRGKGHSPAWLDFLTRLEMSSGTTSLVRSFEAFARMTGPRGLVVVLSDFYDFEGYEEAFRRLFARDFEVLALHILSPEELRPDLEGDLRLQDAEFRQTADVSMGRGALASYGRALGFFTSGLGKHIIGRGGYYLLTSTELPFDRLVLDVLRRKGVLR